jgi:hypothetical protein
VPPDFATAANDFRFSNFAIFESIEFIEFVEFCDDDDDDEFYSLGTPLEA